MYHVNVHFLFTFCAISCRYAVKQWLLLLLQEGNGGEPQPGPSHRPDIPRGLKYNIRKKSERIYAKNAAVNRIYQVKIDEEHHGERLEEIIEGLHQRAKLRGRLMRISPIFVTKYLYRFLPDKFYKYGFIDCFSTMIKQTTCFR